MIKESISLESILEIFVSGGILVLGAWYLNRPVLFEYFPAIAQDVDMVGASGLGGKTVVFLILVLFAGIIITHMFDAVLPVVIGNQRVREGSSYIKRFMCILFLLFSAPLSIDPRISSIDRYLNSSRRKWFLEMILSWTKTDESQIKNYNEKILVHQHVVNRLRVLSEDSKKVLIDAYQPFSFAGSIFIALMLLIPFTLLSFWAQSLVDTSKYKIYSSSQLLIFLLLIWTLTYLSGYSLKRRARTFYSQILTIAMHYYDESKTRESNGK
ncbi:MAG: hypothetical protein HGA52_07185 [Bacteroidales bacterium]|nr:hypothetical protein [Bacteroidales bacterium]